MYTARRSVQAVAVVVVFAIYSSPSYSQSAQFLRLETRLSRSPGLASSANPCRSSAGSSWGAQPGGDSGIVNAAPPCYLPAPSTVNPVGPCASTSPVGRGCAAFHDFVREDLNTMGRQGHSILRARDRVLEILQTGNSCTEWYRTKDADPGATFRTLTFALDRNEDV